MRKTLLLIVLLGLTPHHQASYAQADPTGLAQQVRGTERAFAKTMADRDHVAFGRFLDMDAVFMSDDQSLRGKAAVADGWKRFFEGREAPFSWEPDRVEVLASSGLAFSSGPVQDPQGKRVGTFNSVWRRDASGQWRVVFDKGCPPCDCR